MIVSILSDILSALRPVIVACWIGISLPTWRQVQFYQKTQDWGISVLLRLLDVLSVVISILFKRKGSTKNIKTKQLCIYILQGFYFMFSTWNTYVIKLFYMNCYIYIYTSQRTTVFRHVRNLFFYCCITTENRVNII